jgi:hypothetical protein
MNIHFQRKAADKERAFFKKYGKEGYTFYTVKEAKPNIIQKVTDKYIFVCTEKGNTVNRIPRASLRKALSVLFFRRVTTLKRLIKVNSFSSALAAMIKAIMIDICKVAFTKTGAARLTLRGIRYIFSGLSKGKSDVRIVKENGGQFIVLNFFNIRNDLTNSWKKNLIELGLGYKSVILDPGEKSLYDAMKKGISVKPICRDEYAAFVVRHWDIIHQYFTLDIIGDPVTTKRNTEYLERVVGHKPIPIFHIQNSLDVLQDIVDEGHDVIAIGGSALKSVSSRKREEAFDAIFDRFGDTVNLHGLGLGSIKLLLRYPWFSADASSWLNGRIFGKLITMMGDVRVPLGMPVEKALGFNIRTFAALEDRYTDLQINFEMYPPNMVAGKIEGK